MWDRSYRWQRHVRLAAGLVMLLLLVGGLVLSARTPAGSRTRAGAYELLSDLFSPDRDTIEVDVPAGLHARVGTLVYRERSDGAAQVIGRVVSERTQDSGDVTLAIRLSGLALDSADRAGAEHTGAEHEGAEHEGAERGGIVYGAPASLSMREAVALLVSPDTPSTEGERARDMIWSQVRSEVLPGIVDGLVREISAEIADPAEEDAELLKRLVASLHKRLEPLENDLVNRLAKRAWEVVGVQGVAGGVLNATLGEKKIGGTKLTDWWSWMTRSETKADENGRPFLSEATSKELKAALEEEVVNFWTQNRTRILDAFRQSVDERRDDFERAFQERWSAAPFERVVMPAWQTGQTKVIAAIEAYVNDFANRRLLTSEGGPRLLFAFILRSYLDISDAPLLIFEPRTGSKSNQVVYQPLLK